MTEVVMKKSELLDKLSENKAKHDTIYLAAVDGYWTLAKEKIEEKKKNFYEQIQDISSKVNEEIDKILVKISNKEELPSNISVGQLVFNSSIGLQYPENHTSDYDRAIKMMESSIFDTVSLSSGEFDCYVLNNWSWKKSFISSSANYLNSYSGLAMPAATGMYSDKYNRASQTMVEAIVNKRSIDF